MGRVETLIVGGGIAGIATAWSLARAGSGPVLLLEHEQRLGRHSSGLNAGILRVAIDAPATRALALETHAFLHAPPTGFTTTPLVDRAGLVVLEGTTEGPPARWTAPLRDVVPMERISRAELRSRAPVFREEGARAWLFASAGTIAIDALMAGFADGARAAGATLRTDAHVEELSTDADGRVVGARLAGGERVEAERVVVAGGGWAARLGATAGARFPGRPTRRHLFVTRVDERVDPGWPVVWDDVAGFYARPHDGGLMVCLCDQDDVEPDACVVDPLIGRVLERRLAASLPGLPRLGVARTWAAMRTVTEDDRPVIGPDPRVPGLFWVAALGGHGMSISAGAGRMAADLLLGRPVDPALLAALAPDNDQRAYTPLREYR